MKKSIVTIGLFSLMLVLTSFTASTSNIDGGSRTIKTDGVTNIDGGSRTIKTDGIANIDGGSRTIKTDN
jgi:hypothetical protein